MQITVHHLHFSRSTRILWLLEELDAPYETVHYHRNPETFRAPPELKAAHPLGKSPVIALDGQVVAESCAILEVLAARVGDGRLGRASDSPEWPAYLEWLHMGEGTAMMGMMVLMMGGRDQAQTAMAYGGEVIAGAMDEIEAGLDGRDYLLAGGFSAADIQIAYVAALARQYGLVGDRARTNAWLDRLEARAGFIRAIEKGGPMLPPARL